MWAGIISASDVLQCTLYSVSQEEVANLRDVVQQMILSKKYYRYIVGVSFVVRGYYGML
jgi:hypothetical protein